MGGADGVTKGPVRDHSWSHPLVWRSSLTAFPVRIRASGSASTYIPGTAPVLVFVCFFRALRPCRKDKGPTIPGFSPIDARWSRIRFHFSRGGCITVDYCSPM